MNVSLPPEIPLNDCRITEPSSGVQNNLPKLPDPVKYLAPVMEFFVPIGSEETVTMLGLWFDTVGFLHVYVQQAIIPDNIFTQIKIITLRLPIALGFTIFNLGLAMFFVRAFIIALRATVTETSDQIQRAIQRITEKVNSGQ